MRTDHDSAGLRTTNFGRRWISSLQKCGDEILLQLIYQSFCLKFGRLWVYAFLSLRAWSFELMTSWRPAALSRPLFSGKGTSLRRNSARGQTLGLCYRSVAMNRRICQISFKRRWISWQKTRPNLDGCDNWALILFSLTSALVQRINPSILTTSPQN